MKYGQNISNNEMDTSPKKKYLSPSIRLCKALSLECVMNEGPASAGGYGPNEPSEGDMEEQFSKQRYTTDFYSGYDEY